jgi:hypothetical protein
MNVYTKEKFCIFFVEDYNSESIVINCIIEKKFTIVIFVFDLRIWCHDNL